MYRKSYRKKALPRFLYTLERKVKVKIEDEYVTLSLRGTPALLGLFDRARKLKPINRNALFQEGVEVALTAETDWQFVAKTALDYKINMRNTASCPEFVQLRVKKDKWDEITNQINRELKDLKRLHSSYSVKLVLANFINYLEKLDVEENDKETPISAPEMAAILTSMVLEGSPALIEIEKIMRKYRNGEY